MANSVEETLARLRAHLHSAHMDSGKSVSQLAAELGVGSPAEMSEYLSGRKEMGVGLLLRFARLTGKPVWWFFGEQPRGVTVEGAETGLQNVSRIRLYLDAIEAEFRGIVPEAVAPEPMKKESNVVQLGRPAQGEVVDLRPYLDRARQILQREVDLSREDSAEVSEESVEMIAQGLYSAEMGCLPSRSFEAVE
ncbi:MAG: helix-turn-helix transcriptional regulator [Candidatus Eremiobacteraeota bacterium]|nr:helix-turn-helix transcriptional regulator [Candidatus Eremiobacteraeota bacterium]